VEPPVLPSELNFLINPNGGFLCLGAHWRPRLGDPDPQRPREKIEMVSTQSSTRKRP